jgi:hypothetical protein
LPHPHATPPWSRFGSELVELLETYSDEHVAGKPIPTPGAPEDGWGFVYDNTSGAMVWTALATSAALASETSARTTADSTLTSAAAAAQSTANAALPKAGGTMTGKIVLDGDPTADLHPTPRQYVLAQINALINAAPGTLDTLGEIATQLASDESAAAALTTTVAGKEATANKNVASGYAGLGTDARVGRAHLPEGWLNVTDPGFGGGAKPDNSTISTTRIQAAIGIAELRGHGTVYFPDTADGATYLIDDKLTVNADDITLHIPAHVTVKAVSGMNKNMLRVNTTGDGSGKTRIRGFRITGGGTFDHQGWAQDDQGSGIEGCLIGFCVDDYDLDVRVINAHNTGIDFRGGSGRSRRLRVEDTRSTTSGSNAINLGGHSYPTVGHDNIIDSADILGTCDLGVWFGSSNARRTLGGSITVRSQVTRVVTDAAISSGSPNLTSLSAAFTQKDVGKPITVVGAGASGADLVAMIKTYTSATQVALSANAGTTVSAAKASFGWRGDASREVLDGAMTSGSPVLTSASANFTAQDKGKNIAIIGAGSAGGRLLARIGTVTNATTISLVQSGNSGGAAQNALTTVTNARTAIGIIRDGVLAENGGNSDHLMLDKVIVEGAWVTSVGLGGGGGAGLTHTQAVIDSVLVEDPEVGSTAVWLWGSGVSLGKLVVDGAKGDGLLIGGGGGDLDVGDIQVMGGSISMSSTVQAGSAVKMQQTGTYTNYLHDVELHGLQLIGNATSSAAGGNYGVSCVGKVKGVRFFGGGARGFRNSGASFDTSGGSSPSIIRFHGGDYRNNNQAVNAAGATAAGLAFGSGVDDVKTISVTATDDQGTKTQELGLYVHSAATNIRSLFDSLTGNKTAEVTDGTNGANFRRLSNRDPRGLGTPYNLDPRSVNSSGSLGANNRGIFSRILHGGNLCSKLVVQVVAIDTATPGTSDMVYFAVYRPGWSSGMSYPNGAPVVSGSLALASTTGTRSLDLGATYDIREGDWVYIGAASTGTTFMGTTAGSGASTKGLAGSKDATPPTAPTATSSEGTGTSARIPLMYGTP